EIALATRIGRVAGTVFVVGRRAPLDRRNGVALARPIARAVGAALLEACLADADALGAGGARVARGERVRRGGPAAAPGGGGGAGAGGAGAGRAGLRRARGHARARTRARA